MQVHSQILTQTAATHWSMIVSICSYFSLCAILKTSEIFSCLHQPPQEHTFLILNQSQQVYQMDELFYHKPIGNEPYKEF